MTWFLRMLSAWAISMLVYPVLAVLAARAMGQADSGFQEALLGIGLLIAIPAFVFALVIGVPAMAALSKLRPDWLVPPAAAAVFALLMWMLAALAFPEGWRGAAHALTGYAAVLGLAWGSLVFVRVPAA